MHAIEAPVQDVMQVCRRGHVITDLLHSCPERSLTHCDRCGTVTLDRCPTCGHELAGAFVVPGLQPVGIRRPPLYCSACGAAFPWTERPRTLVPEALTQLETLLHWLPRVIRELRSRHGDRPPFRVQDERDLEDLLRALLPLHFDDIRPQCRTPRYAAFTRTDFLLAPQQVAVTVKFAGLQLREQQLTEQFQEDAAYYRSQGGCRTLVGFVYDPEGLLRDLAARCASTDDDLKVRLVLPNPSEPEA